MAANHNGEDASVDKDRVIPIRRVPLTDQSQLPANYSATPGGTLFSTTPGGEVHSFSVDPLELSEWICAGCGKQYSVQVVESATKMLLSH